MSTDTALEPAVVQIQRLRKGTTSSVELLDQCLERYERYNGELNAVVVTRLDEARQRAAAADAAFDEGRSLGPLHGLPMTIKEVFDWTGTPSTWGDPQFAENVATTNSVVVERLLGAGAVIYGKTNVPINLGDWQTFNAIYGTTNNPWDTTLVPGGSSGGSAVALATGMAALEVGSDIGASIRNPAHYVGLFGHKPTYGVVPVAGHARPGHLPPVDINVAGPLARTAADLELELRVLAGPSAPDDRAYSLRLPEPTRASLPDYRVAVMYDSPCVVQDPALTAQLRSTVDALVEAGLRVDEHARPAVDQERAFLVYLLLLRAATGLGLADAAFEQQLDAARRFDDGDRDHPAILGKGVTLSHRDWLELNNEREQHRQAWAAFFEDYDLLLCPTAASTAFPHDHGRARTTRTIRVAGEDQSVMDQVFWAGWSCGVYLPATVAPAGLTAEGLPCGLQIVGPHLGDLDTVRFAQLMEECVGGFVPPPGYG
ncbi:MAG: amidase [Acidimicrobiales bacterium]